MTVNMYAIKDELAENWGNIILVKPVVSERTFKWMAQEMEKADCEDRRIYLMGTYDTSTGVITPCQPQLIYNLEEAKKNGSTNL